MSGETWKPVPGYEGLYDVSNFGRVKSLARVIDAKTKNGNVCKRKIGGTILIPGKDGHGYFHINLCRNGKRKYAAIHRIVAEAFLPKVDGKEYINHKNSDFTNNAVCNLEWCTSSENNLHGWTKGKRIATQAKPICMCSLSGEVLKTFSSIAEASRNTGICENGIRNCCKNKPKHKTAGGFKWQYK